MWRLLETWAEEKYSRIMVKGIFSSEETLWREIGGLDGISTIY
jgi:hypothetical protein